LYEKGTNARAWVLSIARNLSIDIYRKRSFDCAQQEVEEEENRFDEGSVLFSMEVKKALDTLDDEERQIVTMKVYAELKHKVIAKILDITEDACKKKYQRAISKLRVLL
jgi:RNA polymerase sigma-70 factor (ECF subfamily)